jgi:hypothetical protein
MHALSIRTFTCNCWMKTSYQDTIRCKQRPGQRDSIHPARIKRAFVDRTLIFRVPYAKESRTVAAVFKEVDP